MNNGSSQLLLIYDNIYNAADLSAWKSWLAAQKAAGKPVTIIYRLAQPVITQHDRLWCGRPRRCAVCTQTRAM